MNKSIYGNIELLISPGVESSGRFFSSRVSEQWKTNAAKRWCANNVWREMTNWCLFMYAPLNTNLLLPCALWEALPLWFCCCSKYLLLLVVLLKAGLELIFLSLREKIKRGPWKSKELFAHSLIIIRRLVLLKTFCSLCNNPAKWSVFRFANDAIRRKAACRDSGKEKKDRTDINSFVESILLLGYSFLNITSTSL